MADIQDLLDSGEPFSMIRVRTMTTRVGMEVWKIVDAMLHLAPGRYDVLAERTRGLQRELEAQLAPQRIPVEGPLVLPLDRVRLADADRVGPKLAVLGEIGGGLGLHTPRGFAATATAFARFMASAGLGEEIERRIRTADATGLDALLALSSDIQQLIMDSPLPQALEASLREAADGLRGPLAVRSSALFEDVSGTSFAGLHRSLLNVAAEDLSRAYREVVASLYTLPAMAYRFERGIPDFEATMCVGVLEMVAARSGGVLYTGDPNAREPGMLVNSVWGLPKPVVDGLCDGDAIRISPDARRILSVTPGDQSCSFEPLPREGIDRRGAEPDEDREISLSAPEALALARAALRLEQRFGGPLDIEWVVAPPGPERPAAQEAIPEDDIVILQCRPLTTAGPPAVTLPTAESAGPEGTGLHNQTDSHHETDPRTGPPPLLAGGTTASPGAGGGPVHLILRDADLLTCPEGAVLVAPQARPRLAALLGRANAVVAERGSVTGHLANVCREFGVPALLGVEGAVRALAEGDFVTVDADRRVVLPGGTPDIRRRKTFRGGEETPVHRALRLAADHIVPLHLTDPTSVRFQAENAETFHDITRFCHEKAVEEMFRFGRDHDFPERSSKQLYTHTATRWWVLNLDDGFNSEVEGRHVRLEDIACKPMLALWEGLTAFPWAGPPALDRGGFMAVMFRSTTDPSLAAGAVPKQTERNYFMISRQFCSLTSRLGYHFCTTETLVTDREAENYASFQFQGGAADDERRHRRVALIGDLLEERGFSVVIRRDTLSARIKALPAGEMFRALRVLGHLTIHTRQLDMVMSDASRIRRQGELLREHLDTFAADEP